MIIEKIVRTIQQYPPDHPHYDPTGADFMFWCPGCKCAHGMWISRKNRLGCQWVWNSDFEKPSIQPSIDITYDEPGRPDRPQRCHVVVTDGILYFCPDSTHEFAGKSIPMEPF